VVRNEGLCDHSIVYGVVAKPLVISELAVHDHVGRVFEVGDVVVGIPGVVGAMVSIVN
jgi:hypothetical protein